MKTSKFVFLFLCFIFCSTVYAQIYPELGGKTKFNHKQKQELPDLVVQKISFEFDRFVEGRPFGIVKYVVKNIGNAPAKSKQDDPINGGYVIDLFLSTDVEPPIGLARRGRCEEDVLLARSIGKTIEVGQVVVFVEKKMRVPMGCEECSEGIVVRRLGIQIDPNNKLVELRDDNNTYFQTIPIQCGRQQAQNVVLPDLTVEDVRFSMGFDNFMEGRDMEWVEIDVKNNNTVPANPPYTVDLFLSMDAMPPVGPPVAAPGNVYVEDMLLSPNGNVQGVLIPPGAVHTYRVRNLILPDNLADCPQRGGHVGRQFGVFIDSSEVLAESNEGNNLAFRTILIKCGGN